MELQPEKDFQVQREESGDDPEFVFHCAIIKRRAPLCL
jgi:hypothetical protein